MPRYTHVRAGNPFGLSDGERDTLVAFVKHGTDKATAAALGIQQRSVAANLRRAQKQMGVTNRIHAAVAWVRRNGNDG